MQKLMIANPHDHQEFHKKPHRSILSNDFVTASVSRALYIRIYSSSIYIYHIHISHHTTYFWCPTTSNFHISHSSPGCRWVSTVDLRWILEWSAKIVDGSRRGVLFFLGRKWCKFLGAQISNQRLGMAEFMWCDFCGGKRGVMGRSWPSCGEVGPTRRSYAKGDIEFDTLPMYCKKQLQRKSLANLFGTDASTFSMLSAENCSNLGLSTCSTFTIWTVTSVPTLFSCHEYIDHLEFQFPPSFPVPMNVGSWPPSSETSTGYSFCPRWKTSETIEWGKSASSVESLKVEKSWVVEMSF